MSACRGGSRASPRAVCPCGHAPQEVCRDACVRAACACGRQVMQPDTPGPVVVIADCPTHAHLPALAASPALARCMGGGGREPRAGGPAAAGDGAAACVIHLAPAQACDPLQARLRCAGGASREQREGSVLSPGSACGTKRCHASTCAWDRQPGAPGMLAHTRRGAPPCRGTLRPCAPGAAGRCQAHACRSAPAVCSLPYPACAGGGTARVPLLDGPLQPRHKAHCGRGWRRRRPSSHAVVGAAAGAPPACCLRLGHPSI